MEEDDSFYQPVIQFNKETMNDEYVGPFTFNYICLCLSIEPSKIRKAILKMSKESLPNLETCLSKYKNKRDNRKNNILSGEFV